jgi:hypothetical protein
MRGRGRVKQQAARKAARGRQQAFRERAQIAKTQTNLEYNPSIRAARAEARGSAKREKQIGGWYNQLASDYGAGAQAAQQAFTTAEQATNARLAEAGQRNTAALNEQSAKDDSFAKLVGAPTDASGMSQAAAAAAALERQRVTLAAPLTAMGANFVSSMGSRAAGTRLRGIEARKAEGDRRQKIKSDIGAARLEKGKAAVVAIDKLTRADREAASERAALGLKGKEAATDARQAQARINVSRRNSKISARNAGTAVRNAATTERSQQATERHYKHGDKKGKDGLTPSERNAQKAGRKNALAAAQGLVKASGKGYPKTPQAWAQLEEAVRAEAEVSPGEAQAAIARLRQRQEAQAKQAEGLSRDPSPHGLGR